MPIKENGCGEHDDCLTCPLPVCILDLTGGHCTLEIKERIKEAQSLLVKGYSFERIARIQGKSVRTIQRYERVRLS